jgi:hypothetical protein
VRDKWWVHRVTFLGVAQPAKIGRLADPPSVRH